MLKKLMILSMFLSGNSFAAMISIDTWIEQCENATGEAKKTYDAIRVAKAYLGKASCKDAYIRLFDDKLDIREPITDLRPLSGLTNLKSLIIYSQNNNRLDDIQPLSNLTKLKDLWLGNNHINSVEALAGLTNLEKLWLRHNHIDDISSLKNLSKLRKLHLSYNSIVDVSPLAELKNLKVLDLSNNLINDLSPLKDAQLRAAVYLGSNYIEDLGPLKELTDIELLNLDANKINDFGPVRRFKRVHKGHQQLRKKYPKIPVKQNKPEQEDSTSERAKPNFYAKLVEKPGNFLEFYKQSHDLVELIEDVHQMKLYYTFISNAYRTKLITQQERAELIVWGLDITASHTTCESSIADYKIILDKAEQDRIINRKMHYILDSKAEDKKTENQPYIKDLKWAVQRNTEHLKIIESNVGAINNSLNQLKEGMRHKMAIESTVGFISAVLNALSFGVAGSAVQGAMELTLGNIVDFGDLAHIIEVAEGINDVKIQEIIEFALEVAEDHAEDKLEEASKESYTLAVLTVAAASINPEPQKVNQAENFEQPFLSDFKSDSKFDSEFATQDEDDYPLHSAIKYGDFELLKEEIDSGLCVINMLDKQGRTPADFAAVKGQFEMLELIRSHGGTFKLGSKAKMRNMAKKRKDLKYEFKTRNHLPNYAADYTRARH